MRRNFREVCGEFCSLCDDQGCVEINSAGIDRVVISIFALSLEAFSPGGKPFTLNVRAIRKSVPYLLMSSRTENKRMLYFEAAAPCSGASRNSRSG